jgi:hypothetical protein
LTNATFGLKDCPITVQINDETAFEQPKQPEVIDTGKWPLAITSEQIEGTPA